MPPLRLKSLLSVFGILLISVVQAEQMDANTQWQAVSSSDGSHATARHEASGVSIGNKMYLMGGRGIRPVEVYDSETRRWRVIGDTPKEIHHFQPVAIGTKIYVIGSMTCCYPEEETITTIYVFDTTTETWSEEGSMPAARARGAVAVVLWEGEFYVLGGNTKGHNGGAVDWFDRYDPVTGYWDVLPDAPSERDHFSAVIVDGKLVAAGGRKTSQPRTFANTVAQTDIYDFSTGTWSVGASIPTQRAGALSAAAGDEVLVAGGESNTQSDAFKTTEAYDVKSDSWRTLSSMITARHSGGAAVIGSAWHLVAGSTVSGGGSETTLHETLEIGLSPDTDNDGLLDIDESSIYNTDPEKPDTDNDGATDGAEVAAGSDPLETDTDGDGLLDGAELNTHDTDPTLKDTDDDGLEDDEEVLQWKSNPRKSDTDDDGLGDADEVGRGTNPVEADTDSDTLSDGAEVIAGTNPLDADTDDDGLTDQNDPDPLTPEEAIDPVDPVDPEEGEITVTKRRGAAAFWIMLPIGVVCLSRGVRFSVKKLTI